MRSWIKQFVVPILTTVLLITIACAATVWLRGAGLLRALEFQVYDRWMSERPSGEPSNSPCVIVGITDADDEVFGHPVTDQVMNDALRSLLRAQPAAIGLDLYRDRNEGGNDKERQDFLELVRDIHNPIVVPVKLLAEGNSGTFIAPPETISVADDRVGSINTEVDPDGVSRRGLLFRNVSSEDDRSVLALGFWLALLKIADPDVNVDAFAEKHFTKFTTGVGPFKGKDLDDGGYQFLLDFRGPREIPRISLSDLLYGRVNPELFRDKVVIIGITAIAMKDHIRTPLQHGRDKEFGVEYHARVVDQLIRASRGETVSMRFWSPRAEFLWIAIFCVIGSAVGWSARPPGRLFAGASGVTIAVAAGALVLLCLWIGARSQFQRNLFIPVVPPAIGFMTTTGLVSLYSAVTGRRDRSAMMQLIGHYVSDDVAQLIWRERNDVFSRGRLRTRRLRGTVLFTDLEGFSAISEKLPAPDLMRWLNQYFYGLSDLVKQSGGIIMKFNGDQIVAVFGPPRKRTLEESGVDARNAVRCALHMRRKLVKLNARWGRQNKPQARMRIGIHSGWLVAGSLGSKQRMEWTVIGDTVNTAARLESVKKDLMPDDIAADGCRILISDATAKMLDLSFDVRPLGRLPLKGKARRVLVYGVKGLVTSPRIERSVATIASLQTKKD